MQRVHSHTDIHSSHSPSLTSQLDMPHDCINWTTDPPTRKTPFLILSRGDDHVYTIVPKDLKASLDPYGLASTILFDRFLDATSNSQGRVRPRRWRDPNFVFLHEPLQRCTGEDHRTRVGTDKPFHRVRYRRGRWCESSGGWTTSR